MFTFMSQRYVYNAGLTPPQPTSTPSLVRTTGHSKHNPTDILSTIASSIRPRLTLAPEQFVQFYYKTFDENRAGLGALYVCDSIPCAQSSSRLTNAIEGDFYAHL